MRSSHLSHLPSVLAALGLTLSLKALAPQPVSAQLPPQAHSGTSSLITSQGGDNVHAQPTPSPSPPSQGNPNPPTPISPPVSVPQPPQPGNGVPTPPPGPNPGLTAAILRRAALASGAPLSRLQITSTTSITWRDGCMGISRKFRCTQVPVPGWRVTVVDDRGRQWIYHASGSGIFLASVVNPPRRPGQPFPPQPPVAERPETGRTQFDPVMPTITEPGTWIFEGVESGLWFDPPTTYGFRYTMLDGALFTSILDFPVEVDPDNLFTVSVDEQVLGAFSPGQTVDFVSLLGYGVPEFTITDINAPLDLEDPLAFPLQLAFDREVASFQMAAITAAAEVPEPGVVIGVFVVSALSSYYRRGRHPRA